MTRARVWLLRSAAIAAVVGLAACDASATVSGPRPQNVSRATGSMTTTTMTTASDTTSTCRSGYQIAYRADGTAYCVPMDQ